MCYGRKHKYPENRSALTYWEEEAPSRLDLGKGKYGGPFTEEEVEDVKTFFRMLPLFIAVVAYILSNDSYWSAIDSFLFTTCLALCDSAVNLFSVLTMLLYLFLIRVYFYKYVPSMMSRMSLEVFIALLVIVSKLIVFHFESDISYVWKFLLIPQLFQGLSFTLVYAMSLEFIVAQSPVHMRGVMVGL